VFLLEWEHYYSKLSNVERTENLPCRVCPLASGQVNQMDLADGLVRQPVHEAGLHEGDGEDGVAAAGRSQIFV